MTKQHLTQDWEKEFIEAGADLEHDRWAKWQKYLHSLCNPHKLLSYNSSKRDYEEIETGGLVIPKSRVEHWERQINTSYSDLSEKEKEYDRIEVRKYLPLIEKLVASAKREVIEEVEKKIEKLYSGFEDNKPVVFASISEQHYNQGLYQGRLNAMEIVTQDLFGINGDELKSTISSLKESLSTKSEEK